MYGLILKDGTAIDGSQGLNDQHDLRESPPAGSRGNKYDGARLVDCMLT
jgi:hypothetical protein